MKHSRSINPKWMLIIKSALIAILLMMLHWVDPYIPDPTEALSNPLCIIEWQVALSVLLAYGCLILLADIGWQLVRQVKGYPSPHDFLILAWLLRKLKLYYLQFVDGIKQIIKRE